MENIKQHQTADAIAAVLLLASILSHSKAVTFVALALIVANALGLALSRWVVFVWERISHFIGGIVTKLLIFVVFYAFITPLSWLFRLFNKNLTTHFFIKNNKSYYKDTEGEVEPVYFERMW